jgi:predicted dithiol-disulfide oxidoreductase (DUF899 family)
MDTPHVVSRKEWLAARKDLLAREKEVTHAKDEVDAARREPFFPNGPGFPPPGSALA